MSMIPSDRVGGLYELAAALGVTPAAAHMQVKRGVHVPFARLRCGPLFDLREVIDGGKPVRRSRERAADRKVGPGQA